MDIKPRVFESQHIPFHGSALVIIGSKCRSNWCGAEYHVTLPDRREGPHLLESKLLTIRFTNEMIQGVGKDFYNEDVLAEMARMEAAATLRRFLDESYKATHESAFLRPITLDPAPETSLRRIFLFERYQPMLAQLYADSSLLRDLISEWRFAERVKIAPAKPPY